MKQETSLGAISLTKPNGDEFVNFQRFSEHGYIQVNWIGIQNLETVKRGGTFYVSLIEETPCSKLLNNHSELIGPWDVANEWIVQTWTPKVIQLGLRHMAQVLTPGIYGQMSFHQLHQRIGDQFEIKMFENEHEARQWLLQI